MVKNAKCIVRCLKRAGAPKAAIRKWLQKTNTASSSTTTTLLGTSCGGPCQFNSDCYTKTAACMCRKFHDPVNGICTS